MKYLELALRIAKGDDDSDKNFLLGCVGLRTDGALVIATNIRTKMPEHAAHAESRISKKLDKNCTIWVGRVLRTGVAGLARPCQQCRTLIKNRKIKHVYYTINSNTYGFWDVQSDKEYVRNIGSSFISFI